MKIIEVTLENIKSYADRTTISLRGGVTAILGKNGSGKSTIQEAIGFVLFDSLPFNNNEFVREGASSGTVEVIIELDEEHEPKRYRVIRSAGYSKYGVARYDSERDEWVDQDIDSKKALMKWLCVKFDLKDSDELGNLWESCIGVPQTRFLSDFAQRPGARKTTFDELLNIDAYEESWKVLKGVPDQINVERGQVREGIRELTGEVQSLPGEREEQARLEANIEELSGEISAAKAELNEAETRYDELETIEARIVEIEGDIEQNQQAIEAKESALEVAKVELENAEEAERKCEDAREEYEEHLNAREIQEELEDQISALDELRSERQSQEAELGKLEIRRETLEGQVEKHERAQENLEEYETQKQRYEELDERISELESDQETVNRLQTEIADLDDDARDELTELREEVETIEEIEAKAATVGDPADLRSEIGEIKAEIASLDAEKADLNEKLERLEDAEADAPCPTCGEPLEAEHRTDLIEKRKTRIIEIQSRQETLGEDLSKQETDLAEAEKIETRVAQLDMRRSQVSNIQDDLREIKEERTETREQIVSLREGINELPTLEGELDSLEDANDAYYKAKAQVDEYADAPGELVEVKESIASVEAELERIDEEIDEFGDVEDDLKTVKETLGETEEAYKLFERNKQAAEKLEERRTAVEEIEQELESLNEEGEELTNDLEVQNEAFNKDEYETLAEQISEYNKQINTLSGQQSEKKKTLASVSATVEKLESKLDEREEEIERLRELAANQKFASWVRDNVRAAGPKMRNVITDRIGKRADAIFRSIRGEKAEQLKWTSDYDIVVTDADVQKSFSTLSGGEKMAAALAVRLAILEQISGLGIAFLDEPTANLDHDKKANLVGQLNRLDAFNQLTVISHDSTFDSMTDYSITIEKPHQTSKVTGD